MVVIKDTKSSLVKNYGKSFIKNLTEFSEVIGYTIEEDGNELKVEFNPDRPDLFSFPALREAMKCFYDRDYWINRESSISEVEFRISGNVRKIRKYAIAFIASGRPIEGSLEGLIDYQERIHDNLGKNRVKVSIGLHDLDKLKPPFEYRAVKSDSIEFTTYDGTVTGTAKRILKEHPKGVEFGKLIESDTEVPVILDSDGGVLSMPPVINGLKSKVDEKTRRFFVDITGNDRKAARDAYFLLLYEFQNIGYTVYPASVTGGAFTEIGADGYDGREINLSSDEMKRITGMDPSQKNTIELLRRMGYMAEPSSAWISVKVPGNRVDVMGQVDVIEDVVKAYGLSRIREKRMDLPLIGTPNRSNDFSSLLRDAMIGIGLQEVRTFVVSSSSHYRHFQYVGGIEIRNPKSLDYSVIRDRLHINILELLRINKRRPLPHRVFEIGEVYSNGEQETRFCAVIMDSKASYSSIKQVLDYAATRLGIGSIEIRQKKQEGFIEGRAGSIFFNGKPVGIIGEVDPDVLVRYDLNAPVAALELNLLEVEMLLQ